jgi:integral membrane protein
MTTLATSSSTRSRVTPRSFYRVLSIAEAVTWTLLIAGMLLKYVANAGTLPVLIGGSIHGLVFISYAATAVIVGLNQRWKAGQIVFAVVTAIVPYATIPFDRWLERRGILEGEWRREKTDDPRDSVWVDRLMRWFLNHPILLGVFLVAVIAVVFSVLVTLGPPTEWGR